MIGLVSNMEKQELKEVGQAEFDQQMKGGRLRKCSETVWHSTMWWGFSG